MSHVRVFIISLISLAIGFAVASLLALVIGESPVKIIEVLLEGAFGSLTNLGYSLYYATPLILTGLSVSWAFRSGLFNIGAEGQMAIGGLAMTWVALNFSYLPGPVVLLLSFLTAFIAAGLWGGIAGWMKAYRGAHEVLATILLNYVAYGLVSFCIALPMRNIESQVPETMSLLPSLQLEPLRFIGGQSPLNLSFVIALIISGFAGVVLRKTVFGFRTRMVGEAPGTAERSAVSVKHYTVISMFIAGGLAGLAGMSDIFGYSLKLKEGFTASAGFVGIAVALLGRNSVFGIIVASILFGALQKGALSLDLETDKITRDLAVIIQAFIIFSIASEKGLRAIIDRWVSRRRSNA